MQVLFFTIYWPKGIEATEPHLIGISDYPPKHAFRIKDRRIENYVNIFSELKRRSVTILTKNDVLISPSKAKIY